MTNVITFSTEIDYIYKRIDFFTTYALMLYWSWTARGARTSTTMSKVVVLWAVGRSLDETRAKDKDLNRA
ncbi:unnamed protein product [Amoebophrya sp. A25]|nr:unnamed protein product [Amoebophrya sp. A25]|eukprot:GSA25T00023359001.1